MPRLPDASAFGNRPTPQPSGAVAAIGTGDESALYAGAHEAIKEGQMAEAFAGQFDHMVKVEQDKADTMRAENAFNKLREKQLELTTGEKGFTRVKGVDAVSRPLLQEYGKQFADQVKDIDSSLANDRQRELFRKRADVAGLGYKEDILRHLIGEGKVAEKQSFDGMINVETKTASANWSNPKQVETSMVRILAGIEQQAQSNGWDPTFTEAVRQEKLGKIHDAVIDQAVASGNLVYAKEWYEKNKGDVDTNTAKALQAKVVDATQRQLYNGYQTNYLAVQDNIGGLKALQTAVTKDSTLDEARKNVLIGRVQSQIQGIERRQEAAADRADRRATAEVTALMTRIGQGLELNPDNIGNALELARGRPQVAALLNEAITLSNATRAFRTADPIVQEQMITRAELGVRDGGVAPKVLSTFKTIQSAQEAERARDPVTNSVRQGLVQVTDLAAKPLDVSNPAKLDPNQMQARLDLARQLAVQKRTPFKPLTEQEHQLAVATLKIGTPEQKREYFKGLSLATGDDFAGYKAIMAQIAPDDPVTAAAGLAARRGLTDPKAGRAADLMLDGISILRPNKGTDGKPSGGVLIHQPPEKDMRTKFDDYVRDSMTGSAEARSTAFQTAQAIYASLSRQAGDRDTGVLDSNRWQTSIEMATGGITKHNGRQTVKPWGMPDGAFVDQLDTRLQMLKESGTLDQTVTLSMLRDLPLRPIGDGQYVLASGNGDLGDKTGKRIVIDFNQPLPPEAVKRAPKQPDLARGDASRSKAPRLDKALTQ